MSEPVQHGMPGEWARVRGTVLSLWPLFVAFVLLGAFGAALALGRHAGVFAALFAAALVGVVLMWRKGLRRVESFFKGALGEERVAARLTALPGEYHVFHDLVAGPHHVDHVVAGPTGVFCVETKNWRGQVTVADNCVLVGGHLPSRSPLRQAVAQADAVAALLLEKGWEGTVMPVLCFASDTLAAGRSTVDGVTLVNSSDLVAWIASRPVTLAPDALARLVALLAL